MLPAPYDTIFPEGMDAGVRPYRLKKDAQMVFDRMHKAPDGEVFDLNLCGDLADPMCMMPFPNLT
jgi:predicted lactoylglutathione lyase